MNLSGKVIVVTGGAQGLGLCIAQALANEGAKLALVDLNQDQLDEAVATLEKSRSKSVV